MGFNKVLLLTITLLLLTTSIAHDDELQCDHDNQIFDTQQMDVDEDLSAYNDDGSDQDTEGRLLASSSPKTRIRSYFGYLNSAPAAFRNYIQNELIPPVVTYFSSALRMKAPLTSLLKVGSSVKNVCSKAVPSELRTGVSADYYMMFDHISKSTSTVASSLACFRSSTTNRPLIGYVQFNRQMFSAANGNVLVHEKNTYLIMHEMMHSFGISKDAFPLYLDSAGKKRRGHIKSKVIGGVTQSYIDISAVTTRVRNFYGCSSAPGLILENQGGDGTAGSHFERKFFPYEAMSSGTIHGRRLSQFSLALLEASNWYVADYSYAEPYFFGQGQGCNFLNQKCSATAASFDEFCTGSARKCSPTGRSGGNCANDIKGNGCRWVSPMIDYDCENPDAEDYARLPNAEVYGRNAGSKCFAGSLSSRSSTSSSTSFCFKYSCSGSGSSTKLQVQLGNKTVTCAKKGKLTVSGYYGALDCPDPLEFCTTVGKKYCPRNCMGRGSCVNNKCVCNKGYTGVDCGLFV